MWSIFCLVGCGVQAVSRKTPIYITLLRFQHTLHFFCEARDITTNLFDFALCRPPWLHRWFIDRKSCKIVEIFCGIFWIPDFALEKYLKIRLVLFWRSPRRRLLNMNEQNVDRKLILSNSFFQTKNIKCKTTISIDVNFEMFWYSMKLVWFWCDLLLQRWIVIAWKMAGGKKSREVERNWKVAAGSSSNILLNKRRLWVNSSISSIKTFLKCGKRNLRLL